MNIRTVLTLVFIRVSLALLVDVFSRLQMAIIRRVLTKSTTLPIPPVTPVPTNYAAVTAAN